MCKYLRLNIEAHNCTAIRKNICKYLKRKFVSDSLAAESRPMERIAHA
jgi:hypothetical protein